MSTYPTCELCGGERILPVLVFGDSPRVCPCVDRDMTPTPIERMSLDQLRHELLGWRTGMVFRGQDRVMALHYPELKAEVELATAALERAQGMIKAQEARAVSLMARLGEQDLCLPWLPAEKWEKVVGSVVLLGWWFGLDQPWDVRTASWQGEKGWHIYGGDYLDSPPTHISPHPHPPGFKP